MSTGESLAGFVERRGDMTLLLRRASAGRSAGRDVEQCSQARRPASVVDGFRPAGRVASTPVGRLPDSNGICGRDTSFGKGEGQRRAPGASGEPRSSGRSETTQLLDLTRRRVDGRMRSRRAVRKQLSEIYARRSHSARGTIGEKPHRAQAYPAPPEMRTTGLNT